MSKTELIKFNTVTVDYPKFEIYNCKNIFDDGGIKIIIFVEFIEEWKILIDTIMKIYNF